MQQPSLLIPRLTHAMQARGINARELAVQAGVGASFVYDVLNGNSRNPTASKLAAVAEVLGVSVGWLLEGEATELPDAMIAIPLLATDGAKRVALPETLSPWRFHRSWLEQELGLTPERLRAYEPHDDAMAPTLQPGDTVLVDTSDTTPAATHAYVMLDRLGLTVRRIIPEGDRLKLRADNPAFPEQLLPVHKVQILGKVVWSARKFV